MLHDPDERIRFEWAESLGNHLANGTITRRQLQEQLAALGIDVTVRAIGQWLAGDTAPRPHIQAAIAHLLDVPGRDLWPLTYVAAA